jgi:hypothetical protein
MGDNAGREGVVRLLWQSFASESLGKGERDGSDGVGVGVGGIGVTIGGAIGGENRTGELEFDLLL